MASGQALANCLAAFFQFHFELAFDKPFISSQLIEQDQFGSWVWVIGLPIGIFGIGMRRMNLITVQSCRHLLITTNFIPLTWRVDYHYSWTQCLNTRLSRLGKFRIYLGHAAISSKLLICLATKLAEAWMPTILTWGSIKSIWVAQHVKKAATLIANAEQGRFPLMADKSIQSAYIDRPWKT